MTPEHKKYEIDGYEVSQIMDGKTGLRVMMNRDGTIKLQKRETGVARGEETQTYWIDIPVVDYAGNFIGYEISSGFRRI